MSSIALTAPAREAHRLSPLRKCRRAFIMVGLFSLGVNVLMLTAPLYMMQVFDRVLTSRSVDTLLFLSLIAAIAYLTFGALDMLRGWTMIGVGTWLDRRLSGSVLLAGVRLADGRQRQSASALQDVSTVRGFLSGPQVLPIFDAPWVPLYLGVVFLLHPLLGWVGAVGMILLFVLALANDLLTRRALKHSGQLAAIASDGATAAIRNADAVRAMGMEGAVVERWNHAHDGELAGNASAARRGAIITSMSKMLRQMLQVAILGVGAWLVLGNELGPGGMIAASILIGRGLAPIEQSISAWRSAIGARLAYRRLRATLEAAGPEAPSMELPKPKGKLTVERLTFAHPGDREPLLRNIAFDLEPGESLGLIGPTASGKTTLGRLLVGNLRPQLGSARLDGAELSVWPSQDRGQHIGYLAQDIELFGGTVRENIARLGDGDPASIVKAARLAGVHEMILRLPKGYETEIGSAGLALSGGQRQRIALARAVYGDPRLVVLDEPNASLDQVGEAAVIAAIDSLKAAGTTVVVIAHRPSVLRRVDKLLVLNNGQAERYGDRATVLAGLTNEKPRERISQAG